MKATIKAVRAITGVYFQRLITASAVVGGIFIIAIWALIIWLSTTVDALWGLFIFLLLPLTIASLVIYGLMMRLGGELIPRALSKDEMHKIGKLGDKVFHMTETKSTPWPYHLLIISKDVLRGKESSYIRDTLANTRSLKQDYLDIRQLFTN